MGNYADVKRKASGKPLLGAPTRGASEGASSRRSLALVEKFWGCLDPVDHAGGRIVFPRTEPTIRIGSGADNDVVLRWAYISDRHCIFSWDGQEEDGGVEVCDISSNGTSVTLCPSSGIKYRGAQKKEQINDVKVGKCQKHLVRDGNDIYIGVFHYIYRHLVKVSPSTGRNATVGSGVESGQCATDFNGPDPTKQLIT